MVLSRIVMCLTFAVAVCTACLKVQAEPTLMSFDGQMFALSTDLKSAMEKDKVLKEFKTFRLGRFVCNQSSDVNFEPRIVRELEKNLGGLIDKKSKISLSGTYTFSKSESADNTGLNVIVIRLTIQDSKGAELLTQIRQSKTDSEPEPKSEERSKDSSKSASATTKAQPIEFIREINSSSDIALMIGATVAFDNKSQLPQRNKLVSAAFESPSFGLIRDSKTQVTTIGGEKYGVEIIKRPDNIDAPKDAQERERLMTPVEPNDSSGHAYAPISIGEVYALRLYNYDSSKSVVAKVLIDGLEAINTYNEDTTIGEDGKKVPVSYSGYTLPKANGSTPAKTVVWGWLRTVDKESDKNVYEFVVNKLGEGAASEKMATTGIGVITVEFYEVAGKVGNTRSVNQPGETGKGKTLKLDLVTENLQLNREPSATISIRYNPSDK